MRPPTHTPTPTPATPRPSATPTATSSPSPTPTLTPTATPATVRLVLTEAKANELAAKQMAGKEDAPLKNMKIDFRPGAVYLSGKSKVGFFYVDVVIVFQIQARAGKPHVIIDDIFISGVPASGSMRQRIEAMIAPHLANLNLIDDNFYVESIEITDDKMITTGHYQ